MAKHNDERMSLDAETPRDVVPALSVAIDAYRCSEMELNSAWQDKSGRVWGRIATILERARVSIDREVRAWEDA